MNKSKNWRSWPKAAAVLGAQYEHRVNVLLKVLPELTRALGEKYDIEMVSCTITG